MFGGGMASAKSGPAVETTEAEEAHQIIEERLQALMWMTWDELSEYDERTEQVVTPSGRRFELYSCAYWDMEPWQSGLNIEVKVRPESGWRRRWRYRGFAERGDAGDAPPDPPPGWVPYRKRKRGQPGPPLPAPPALLQREFEAHRRSSFPSLSTDDETASAAHAELAELDGHVAGLLSHIVGGSDLPSGMKLRLDPALRERLATLAESSDWSLSNDGAALLWTYDRLAQLTRLGERALKYRGTASPR